MMRFEKRGQKLTWNASTCHLLDTALISDLLLCLVESETFGAGEGSSVVVRCRSATTPPFHDCGRYSRFPVHRRSTWLINILRRNLRLLVLQNLLILILRLITHSCLPQQLTSTLLLILEQVIGIGYLILLTHVVCREYTWVARLHARQIRIWTNFLQFKHFMALSQTLLQILRKVADPVCRFKSAWGRNQTVSFGFTKFVFVFGSHALRLYSLQVNLIRRGHLRDQNLSMVFIVTTLLNHWWVSCGGHFYIFKLKLLILNVWRQSVPSSLVELLKVSAAHSRSLLLTSLFGAIGQWCHSHVDALLFATARRRSTLETIIECRTLLRLRNALGTA